MPSSEVGATEMKRHQIPDFEGSGVMKTHENGWCLNPSANLMS